jgi:hypothetical protein
MGTVQSSVHFFEEFRFGASELATICRQLQNTWSSGHQPNMKYKSSFYRFGYTPETKYYRDLVFFVKKSFSLLAIVNVRKQLIFEILIFKFCFWRNFAS